jgi:hypothetical protein
VDRTKQLLAAMLPTCVGVNRGRGDEQLGGGHAPHVRGGEPALRGRFMLGELCSPRAWG